jgi:hypothetical protein
MVLGAMMFSDVWAVYGIGVVGVERGVPDTVCVVSDGRRTSLQTNTDRDDQTCTAQSTPMLSASAQTSPFVPPILATPYATVTASPSAPTAQSSNNTTATFPGSSTYMPLAPSSPPPSHTTSLSTAAKAGIISASIILFLALSFLLLEYTYLRRKRRERSRQRAVEEVERGTELKDASGTESKENMVLESRVEIVVDEEGSDSGSEDGGWDAGTEGEDSDEDGDLGDRGRPWERGRNGMSLPRREY